MTHPLVRTKTSCPPVVVLAYLFSLLNNLQSNQFEEDNKLCLELSTFFSVNFWKRQNNNIPSRLQQTSSKDIIAYHRYPKMTLFETVYQTNQSNSSGPAEISLLGGWPSKPSANYNISSKNSAGNTERTTLLLQQTTQKLLFNMRSEKREKVFRFFGSSCTGSFFCWYLITAEKFFSLSHFSERFSAKKIRWSAGTGYGCQGIFAEEYPELELSVGR